MYRGYIIPVYFFGAIGYGYKSQSVNIRGIGKNGAFTQVDYLTQVLEPHIESFLGEFRRVQGDVQFIEDSNSAHSHKSWWNPYIR